MGKAGIKHIFILICIMLLGLTTLLHAKPLINWHDGTKSYTDFDVEYFEEKTDRPLTFQQIRSQSFEPINNNFTFGYNTNNFWFRLRVFNDSNTSKDIYLELTEIIHKHLDLYIISSDNTVKLEKNGLAIPVDQRQIKVSNPTFSIQFDPFEEKELYIKLNTIYGVFGAIQLKTPQSFHETNQFKEKLYIFYYGAVLTLVLYNLFIFFYLREIIYLYYVSYVTIFIIWSANYKGLLLPYTTMETYDQLQITIPVFFSLLILFSQKVLDTRKYFIRFHYWLNAFIVILMISLVWMAIDMHSGFSFMNMIASPLLPFLLLVAFWALYKGHNIAKIYLLALSIYLISMAILSQMALGAIPYSLLFSNAPIIGSFFEIILLSLLLAYRINILREEKIKTQKILIEHKANEETRLIKMVEEKTDELSMLNEKLQKQVINNQILLDENKQFIGDMVHQVRTPLSVIMTNASLIEMKTKEQVSLYTEQINSAINMLSNSYEDLSYIISNDIIEYKPIDINFTDFIKERANFFEVIAHANKKTINRHIASDIKITMNDTELERLIDNNLSNAIKHSNDGSEIEIILEKNNSDIILKFISTGEKISDVSMIFNRNYTETYKAKRSLGLGLSMVKTICEKNRIDYRAQSEKGINTFTYIFKA